MGKFAAGRRIRKPRSESSLLTLHGESAEYLPLVREPLDGRKFKPVIGVVVQLWNVGHHKIKGPKLRRIGGLEAKKCHRLSGNGIENRCTSQRGDRRVIRRRNRSVLDTDQVLLRAVVIRDANAQITQNLSLVPRADLF